MDELIDLKTYQSIKGISFEYLNKIWKSMTFKLPLSDKIQIIKETCNNGKRINILNGLRDYEIRVVEVKLGEKYDKFNRVQFKRECGTFKENVESFINENNSIHTKLELLENERKTIKNEIQNEIEKTDIEIQQLIKNNLK